MIRPVNVTHRRISEGGPHLAQEILRRVAIIVRENNNLTSEKIPVVNALFQPFNYFSGCGQIALDGRHTILNHAPCWEDALGLSRRQGP
jgi:hypothetical protein